MADADWPDRWKHIQKLLERSGPFAEADFEAGPEVAFSAIACVRSVYLHKQVAADLKQILV